jgi:hypothetical protein
LSEDSGQDRSAQMAAGKKAAKKCEVIQEKLAVMAE